SHQPQRKLDAQPKDGGASTGHRYRTQAATVETLPESPNQNVHSRKSGNISGSQRNEDTEASTSPQPNFPSAGSPADRGHSRTRDEQQNKPDGEPTAPLEIEIEKVDEVA